MGNMKNKQSKRQPARQRYKIEKKIRQHNKKVKRENKKNPKKVKQGAIQVPNICPFKEDILKEVEAMKKLKEEEKRKAHEAAKFERQKTKEEAKKAQAEEGLEGLVNSAESREKLHEAFAPSETDKTSDINRENSVKAYYKEFKKVVEAADVILEVVDARDPLGTHCTQVEQAVKEMKGNKRLVIIMNKADLVPRDVLDKWLKFIRTTTPCLAFKASTQSQSKRLGQKKLAKNDNLQGSSSAGSELIMSLLANYCRNKGIKTSIRVGVVGLPNVGKSSLINSLKRSRACNVGATPGVTRAMQEVQLDSKIKLLDSPGIVFAAGSDSSASLRNAVRISQLADPITPANAILQRVNKQQMMEMYDIHEYSTPEEFYSLKAARTGRFKKGGVPNSIAAARGLLEDWNSGKIKYYTIPPEANENDIHLSSKIVSEVAKEFDLDSFEAMETDILNKMEKDYGTKEKSFVLESLGPVDSIEEMEEDTVADDLLGDNISVASNKKEKKKGDARVKKPDPEMQLEGNLKLNQIRKKQFKKEKKERTRRDKVATQLSAGLENFNIGGKSQESYDFNTDFN
ncbi:unnamed protein product [Brassicogethes aeneus]|uniref:Guanine nucleotide-binding protein-like 3 homolog n=1 Tax=Brassicogethes aeneus TaxID=1431903 RepID=A0A9P0FI53_BRAAE|nr:unnamed protein product [Brassicogethes aeneus]